MATRRAFRRNFADLDRYKAAKGVLVDSKLLGEETYQLTALWRRYKAPNVIGVLCSFDRLRHALDRCRLQASDLLTGYGTEGSQLSARLEVSAESKLL
jgi:hypothetical protein